MALSPLENFIDIRRDAYLRAVAAAVICHARFARVD